jgi:hypothetical protein
LSSLNKSETTYHPDAGLIRAKRLRFTVCRLATLLQAETREKGLRRKVAMLTLTYRPEAEYSPRHISSLTNAIQKFATRQFGGPVPYVWVGELTKRGKLHYHVALWIPSGRSLPMPDKQGWWPHGSTRIEWAKFAPGYLAKYVSKVEWIAEFPKGLRLYGFGGVSDEMRGLLRFEKLPTWVKDEAGGTLGHDLHRNVREGGGVVARATGELLASPWAVLAMTHKGPKLARVRPVAKLSPVD